MKAPVLSTFKYLALILLVPVLLIVTNCGEDEDLSCTIGAVCDDGNANTENDQFNSNCECVGTVIDCDGIGDTDDDGVCADVDCDDNDVNNTETDQDGDGVCTPDDCEDNDADIYPGAACDDGNPATLNDSYNGNCVCEGVVQETFTDPRDGTDYLLIDIGTQTWMAENLNYDTLDSKCYDEDPANCTVYGRLYNYSMAQDVCPDGFHLPTRVELETLIAYLGGGLVAGGKLKEAGLDHWNAPNTDATNESGFTALPGGWKTTYSDFEHLGDQTNFWSSDQPNAQNGYTLVLGKSTGMAVISTSSATILLSVRCLED